MKQVTVIGAGHWGTALALVAARGRGGVRLWAYEPEVVESIRARRENSLFLPGVALPEAVRATNSLGEALAGAEVVVCAAPSHVCRALLTEMRPHLRPEMLLVSATKGIENATLMRMSEVAADVLGDRFEPRFVALSGPTFAAEVARGEPAAAVVAARDSQWVAQAQAELSAANFRLYTNHDLVGVEYCGALKNVVALAAGMVTGLGYGYNTAAAVVTRGLAEITRLALAQGGRVETMAGLAGVGDLVLTCFGALSRNRRVGIELGRGRRLEEIIGETREVAEGVKTAQAAYGLARRAGVEMPIAETVYQVLYEGQSVRAAAVALMERPLKGE